MEEELTPEILAARAKLRERFGQSQQLGGKGTARRKTKKVHKSVVLDDKKLQFTLKRLGVSTIYGIEEVIMMHESGKVLQFLTPKVQAAPGSNTYVVSGHCEERSNAFGLPGSVFATGRSGGGAGIGGGMNFDNSLITPEMLRQLQQHVSALKNSSGGAGVGGMPSSAGSAEAGGSGSSTGAESRVQPQLCDKDRRVDEVVEVEKGDSEKLSSLSTKVAPVSCKHVDDDVPELVHNFEDISKE